MENIKKNIYFINVTLLGDSQVGKTTIKDRLLGKQFNINTITTTCPPYKEYFNISNSKKIPNSDIFINIWDTAGQEKYRSQCAGAIKRADIILFIRDHLHDNLGKENADSWIATAENSNFLQSENVIKIFCLNKTDLIDENTKNEIREVLTNISSNYPSSKVFVISSKNDNDIQNLKNDIIFFAEDLTIKAIKSYNHEVNAILFGPSMVGKTTLINRIIYDYYQESTILTLKLEKTSQQISLKDSCHFDFKNHDEIKINYFDIPGQIQYMEKSLNILKKAEIIIFVNDNENLEVQNKIIEQKITLFGKKIIFCINKSDLISKKNTFLNDYKNTNKKILENNNNIFIVSAKDGDGIKGLKESINSLAIDILKEKKTQKSESDKATTVERQFNEVKIINLDNIQEVEVRKENSCKKCWKSIIDIFK